jgi:hypothetical protein
MAFQKAVKTQAKLRLALCGLAGAGKTYSALAVASAMSKMIRDSGHGPGKIAVIDSEHGSASLYADKFEFDVCELDTFSPLTYVEKIREAESAGYDIILIDSLTHAWAGKDGALEQKDKATDRDPRANSWTAWRNVTPKHTALVDAMVGSKSHIIATMRQKMEHVQEVVNGRTEIRKVGLASIQREGMEYEFTLVGDIDLTHMLKISKTRIDGIDVGDMFEKPGEDFARRVYGWLMSGAPPRPRDPDPTPTKPANDALVANDQPTTLPPDTTVADAVDEVFAKYLADIEAATDRAALDKAATGSGKPLKGTTNHLRATNAYKAKLASIIKAQESAA